METGVKLRFGAEIEVLTGSRESPTKSWSSTAKILSSALNKTGITSHVNEDLDKSIETYKEWTIIPELTLRERPEANSHGVELTSPIYLLADPKWKAVMDGVWAVLREQFDTTVSGDCGFHVHVSPAEGRYTLEQAKHIALAAVYFERSIDSVMPIDRRTNMNCQSNRWNPHMKNLAMVGVFNTIKAAESFDQLSLIMCFHSRDSAYAKIMGKNKDFCGFSFRWNFRPLQDGGYGTIEFRQAPAVHSPATTRQWILFATSFIQAAIKHGSTLNPATPANMDMFQRFIKAGTTLSETGDPAAWDNFFQGKPQLPPGAYDLKGVTIARLDELKAKAKENNITLEKFKKLYGYK